MRTTWIVIVAALLVGGCAVGPDHREPVVDSPAAFRGGAEAPVTSAAEAASLADLAWWDVFEDPALAELIEQALQSNHDLEIATWRVAEARALAGIARSERHPAIQAGAGWSRGRFNEFQAPVAGTVDLYDANVGASWEIDLWGRIRRLNEAARARYLATEEARRAVVLSLVSEVARTYFELRTLDEEREIAERTATAFGETFDLFNRRLEAGTASALETSSAAASAASTAATIPELERRIAEREHRLAVLLGKNPSDVPRGVSIEDQVLPVDVPAGLPSDLLRRRPDLRRAEQELIAANADVGVAVAEYFPRLSLTAAFGGVSPELSELFDDGRTWSVGGGLLSPIFQGKRLRQQHRAALARWEQARAVYERDVTTAFAEVSTSLVAYRKLAEEERELVRAVGNFREAVEHASTRYFAGLSGYLEVLEARRELFPAEIELARTRLGRLAALVDLYRTLGGGWQLADDWARGSEESGVGAPVAR